MPASLTLRDIVSDVARDPGVHAPADAYVDLAQAMPWGVIVHTGWTIAFANDAAVQLLGARASSELLERPVCEVMTLLPSHLEARAGRGRATFSATSLIRLDGTRVPASVAALPCHYLGRPGAQLIAKPLPDARAADPRELALRRRDLLTELPNRLEFRERVLAAIGRARRNVTTLGVVILDIAGFAQVNAEHGHAVGDLVLQGVARRLLDGKRQGDTLARIGGDAFGILLEGMQAHDLLGPIVKRFVDTLDAPLEIEGRRLRIRIRAGATDYPRGGNAVDTLLTNAEVALNAAKSRQEGGIGIFTTELEDAARRERARRTELVARFSSLTMRERQVVEGLVAGRSNKAIAKWLSCSPRTVERIGHA